LAEKTAKNLGGYFFAAPYSGIDAVADIERWWRIGERRRRNFSRESCRRDS